MSVNRVLVTGATGLLGPYVRAAFPDKEVVTTARKNSDWDCDLTDKAAVRYLIQKVGPDAVVHLMALTDVDYCEANPQVAQMFNTESVDHIVAELEPDATLVYLSSDQVYPGDGGPYAEDAADPINVYGQSKLSGELAALRHANSLCLRANLFGPSRTEGRASLSDFVVEALRQEKPVTLFQDILFSPLHMDTLARYVRRSIEEELRGVFNLGCREGMSKADFALSIARHKGLPTTSATMGESHHLPGRARRPADMRMDVSLIEEAIGETMPTLECEIGKL